MLSLACAVSRLSVAVCRKISKDEWSGLPGYLQDDAGRASTAFSGGRRPTYSGVCLPTMTRPTPPGTAATPDATRGGARHNAD